MKKAEIKVGGVYCAKVSGKLTEVRVDAITEHEGYQQRGYGGRKVGGGTRYAVTNLKTGRQTAFRSATKFRWQSVPDPA